MFSVDNVLYVILHFIFPYGFMLGTFFLLVEYLQNKYDKANLDIFWKKTFVKNALILGTIAIIIYWFKVDVIPWMHVQAWWSIWEAAKENTISFFKNSEILASILDKVHWLISWVSVRFTRWFPTYWNAFVIVYFLGTLVELVALKWRVSFARAINVLIPTIVTYPRIFLYLGGKQTPVKDYLLSGKIKAKLRENLNDADEDAVQGIQDNGQKFENGAGGTRQTQVIKARAIAMRRSKVSVRTTADGMRNARIFVLQSRETETDKAIDQALKGFGEKVSENSIYFPSDARYVQSEKGFVFDSAIPYDAGDELGSWRSIFVNPFAIDNKISNGGRGALTVYQLIIQDIFKYLSNLTPYAIYKRLEKTANTKYKIDTSADKAKYKVQQNLDLSVLSEPKDPKTGRGIDEQRKLAIERATSRVQDVTMALSGFKLGGQFKDVQVGGNTAIYTYTLPPDPNLPTDFNKVQQSIGNLLRINSKPIITLEAGNLKISMDNGVNIPVSFADMIKRRKKGSSAIISGMVGIDAMGEPIYFELGDKSPHAIFFGKTGTGKTVSLETILYSVMSATDPKHLRIAYVDGKGNSFEFMGANSSHPNPFTYAPPGDANGDIEYSRAVIRAMQLETRRRIDLFKKAEVAKLSEYNEKLEAEGKEILPEILFIVDEFSAITQQDKDLKASESKMNTIDQFEYLAKMSRSVGIRLLLANQSARKELVPGKISANITGRVSLGVSEPIESEIALPETGIAVHLISQPGEFYSIMNGPLNPEHGNSPYIPQKEMNKLNDSLIEKFGKLKYVMTRDDVMATLDEEGKEDVPEGVEIVVPEGIDKSTPLDEIAKLGSEYYGWLKQNTAVIMSNDELTKLIKNGDIQKRIVAQDKANKIVAKIDEWLDTLKQAQVAKTHASTGGKLSISEQAEAVTVGNEKSSL